MYDDGARETLQGCSKCGSKFFFYISKEKLEKIQVAKTVDIEIQQQAIESLTEEDKQHIEQDVREIVGIKDIDAPIILDLESVKITSPGKYVLDVPNLFNKKRPLVYKLEDGKYVIDLSSAVNTN
jgi:predicted  nucleic acid-binding Zn-ribbon protein